MRTEAWALCWLLDGKPHAVPSFSYPSRQQSVESPSSCIVVVVAPAERERERERSGGCFGGGVRFYCSLSSNIHDTKMYRRGSKKESPEEELRSNRIDLFSLNINKIKRRRKRIKLQPLLWPFCFDPSEGKAAAAATATPTARDET